MQVTYTLEPADLTQFEKFGARRRRQGFNVTRFIRIVVILSILMAITYALETSSHPHPPTARPNFVGLVISIVIPLAVIAGVWTFLLHGVKTQQRSVSLFSRRQTLEVRPENLWHGSEGIESTIQWSRIQDLTSDDRSLYFFTDEVTAYIVPRRAFQAPLPADTFLTTALAYWKGNADNADPKLWPPAPRLGG